jgi:hypothetical protein
MKDAYKVGALIITKLKKEGCISLITGRKLSWVTRKHDYKKCGAPPKPQKHIFSKQIYQIYKT